MTRDSSSEQGESLPGFTGESSSLPPAPIALASLGSLRECVIAATNLKGLLASLRVGPKVLRPLLPDVDACLSHWQSAIPELVALIEEDLDLEKGQLTALREESMAAPIRLATALRAAAFGAFGAKTRLDVERRLNELLPVMSSTVAQMELLVGAKQRPSNTVHVDELFTPPSKTSSSRPYRPVSLFGKIKELEIVAPAQLVSACLGCLASTIPIETGKSLGLRIGHNDESVEFHFFSTDAEPPLVMLPVFIPSRHSRTVVAAALSPHAGRLSPDGQGVLLNGRERGLG
jgi:hypothetical protein